jgi:hypothetical protein
VYQKPYPEYFDRIPYPRGLRVPDFTKFTGYDSRTTYEHICQFLALVNDVGITDVHKVRLFPLSLSGTAFNWFTSLAPNSVVTWPCLEQKFHDYFYNGEVELKLSDLTAVRQKYNETVSEYLKRFRETRNRCYNQTIGEKNHADLAFAGFSSYLKEKMEGQDFVDVNQVLQRAVVHENHARDNKSYRRFKDGNTREKEKQGVNFVEEESTSDSDAEICVAEWVDTPKHKSIPCSFLKPSSGRKEEVKYTFDVSKCDKLFDVLVQGGVIKLKEGHVIPTAEYLAKKRYRKWHDSYSHTTNECNYFRQQVQSALNDGRLTLGDGGKMKLDVDLFPVNTIGFGEKKILVRTDQAETTKGKNVVVSDELRNQMVKPRSPEVGVWKENVRRKPAQKISPDSSMLIDKYVRQRERRYGQQSGFKREGSPGYHGAGSPRDYRTQSWQGPARVFGAAALPRATWMGGRMFAGAADVAAPWDRSPGYHVTGDPRSYRTKSWQGPSEVMGVAAPPRVTWMGGHVFARTADEHHHGVIKGEQRSEGVMLSSFVAGRKRRLGDRSRQRETL